MADQRERRPDGQLDEDVTPAAPAREAPGRGPTGAGVADFSSFDWSFQAMSVTPGSGGGPAAPAKKSVETIGGGTYAAAPGESLRTIAETIYGHSTFWQDIADANRHAGLRGPSVVRGDLLTLPAIPTIEVMTRLEPLAPAALRDLATSMSDADYAKFLDSMSDADRNKHQRVIQVVELMRGTGMTMEEMAHAQAEFIQEQIDDGKSMQEQIDEHNALRPKAKNAPTPGANATDEERAAWVIEFPEVKQKVIDTAPPEVTAAIDEAIAHGGGNVVFDPHLADKTLASTSGNWNMTVGPAWLAEAKLDPARVHSTFLHEMKGHGTYNVDRWLGMDILEGASKKLEGADGETLERNAFGVAYSESEIIAELYEFSIDSSNNASDHPFDEDPEGNIVVDPDPDAYVRPHDVLEHLRLMQHAFAPVIAVSLIRSLWTKIERDPNILPRARTLFRQDVKDVFGVSL